MLTQDGDRPAAGGAPPGTLSRRRFLAGTATVAAVPVLGAPAVAGATTAKPPKVRRPASALPKASTVLARRSDLADLEMVEIASLLQAGAVSSRELTEAAYTRIEARDGDITAWIRLYPEIAYRMAAAADTRLARARRGRSSTATLLTGIPVGIKDIIAIKGLPLTFGSAAFADNVAPGDAPVWLRLKEAGVVLLGHTRTLEFASGSNPQTASNPWDITKSPGGSSNGSGAAVAARQVWMALGTDSGGASGGPPPPTACAPSRPPTVASATGGSSPPTATATTWGPSPGAPPTAP